MFLFCIFLHVQFTKNTFFTPIKFSNVRREDSVEMEGPVWSPAVSRLWCHPREGSHLRVLSTSLLNLVSCVLLLTHHVQTGYTTGTSNWACPKLTPWYLPWSHKPGPPTSMTSFLSIAQTKKTEIILDFFFLPSNPTSDPSMVVGRITAYRDLHVFIPGTWECVLWRPKGPKRSPS